MKINELSLRFQDKVKHSVSNKTGQFTGEVWCSLMPAGKEHQVKSIRVRINDEEEEYGWWEVKDVEPDP